MWGIRLGRRGAVAVLFAAALIPLAIGVGAAVDFSRLAAGRSAMQRAVDNAALSGASAYVLYSAGDTYNAVALTVAKSAFCAATTTVPAGYALSAVAGGGSCATAPGAAVTATIGGYRTGTPGVLPASGCSATKTVVSGATCGFMVTVSAAATMSTLFPYFFGPNITITVTATAVNPFINLATALSPKFGGSARYADSLWVYPLLLDANGGPDFTTNSGALPDSSACTGDPNQTSCGSYVMLASTKYVACTTSTPCTVGTTVFGGTGGVVQNPAVGNAIITATTPLGFALESTSGAPTSYGYNGLIAPNLCTWPYSTYYSTISQVYDVNGNPVLLDSNGHWLLPTHWFYSSYLKNGLPPSQSEIILQSNGNINPATGFSYSVQDIPPVQNTSSGFALPATCANANLAINRERFATTYPTTGNTNCALYIVKDPTSFVPDPTLKVGLWQTPSCFTPTNTPGAQYAALSCQSFQGHTYMFFWNDMGGRTFDDTDYNNGSMLVACSGPSSVLLIN